MKKGTAEPSFPLLSGEEERDRVRLLSYGDFYWWTNNLPRPSKGVCCERGRKSKTEANLGLSFTLIRVRVPPTPPLLLARSSFWRQITGLGEANAELSGSVGLITEQSRHLENVWESYLPRNVSDFLLTLRYLRADIFQRPFHFNSTKKKKSCG